MGQVKLLFSDPEIFEAIQNDKTIAEKDSCVGKFIFGSCIANNIFSMDASEDQSRRRKAIMNMVTGKANF